jgi:PAS domain S-box-containing protein
VFTHAHEGIMITDATGCIVEVNNTFSRITGYSREEALGQNVRLLKSGRHDSAFYAGMWRDLIKSRPLARRTVEQAQGRFLYAEKLSIAAVRNVRWRIPHYVALFSDITELKEHQQQLEHMAHYDALTGIPNRVLLADRLQQAIAQSQRRKRGLALVYLDLDGFKEVNDLHGHETGDLLLIAIAQAPARYAARRRHAGAPGWATSSSRSSPTWRSVGECEACILSRLLQAAAAPVKMRQHTCRCRPVSASRSFRRMAATRIPCCATPTRPCIRPSRPARTATTCSTPSRTGRRRRTMEAWSILRTP